MSKVPTEIYSRVVGYYRPVNQWNKGKQAEYQQRREAVIDNETIAVCNEVTVFC